MAQPAREPPPDPTVSKEAPVISSMTSDDCGAVHVHHTDCVGFSAAMLVKVPPRGSLDSKVAPASVPEKVRLVPERRIRLEKLSLGGGVCAKTGAAPTSSHTTPPRICFMGHNVLLQALSSRLAQ